MLKKESKDDNSKKKKRSINKQSQKNSKKHVLCNRNYKQKTGTLYRYYDGQSYFKLFLYSVLTQTRKFSKAN